MSYILDALKKAESERERGAVPGLNSAQNNSASYIDQGPSRKPWWLVLVAVLMVLALVLAVWAMSLQPGDATLAPAAARAAPGALPPAAPAEPTSLPRAALALEAAGAKPIKPEAESLTAPPDSAHTLASSPVAHVVAKVAVPPTSPVVAAPTASVSPEATPKNVPVPAPVPAPVAPSVPIRSASGGVPILNELPDALRRQIPALNISGAIYSDAPPEWTLIINDQVMGKGSQVAPDVRLEEITASSAVFNFKGQRFRIER